MSEMVLVLPFLVFFLALILYFGRGVLRVQRDQVMDRYEAWREASGVHPPPTPAVPSSLPQNWRWPVAPGPNAGQGNIELNQTFYMGHALSVDYQGDGSFPSDAGDQLVSKSTDQSDDTGKLARTAVNDFDHGRTATLTVTHRETVPLWKTFDGPIKHTSTRLGFDWRFVNGWAINDKGDWLPHEDRKYGETAWMLPPVRDNFLSDMDGEFKTLDDQKNELAHFIRGIYTDRPGYVGPNTGFPNTALP